MQDAWGRWGADDQIGAPNLIGADQVRMAAALVRTGRIISLCQPLSSASATPAHRTGIAHFMSRDGGDYSEIRADGFQFADDTIIMPLHSGTHVDALCHCWYDGKLYNGHSASLVRSSGARRCGVENIPPIVSRGVLLDFVRLTGAPLRDGFTIDAELVQSCLNADALALRPGDVVLLRTGWQETRDAGAVVNFDTEPGIDVSAAQVLAHAGVALIGADNFAIEAMPFPQGKVFPVHQRLIRDFGIPLLEGAILQELGEAGATEFMFVGAALPVQGATGSPLHPIAIL